MDKKWNDRFKSVMIGFIIVLVSFSMIGLLQFEEAQKSTQQYVQEVK